MDQLAKTDNIVDIPEGAVEDDPSELLTSIRRDPNLISKWLPAILPKEEEERLLAIPKTVILPVPNELAVAFFMDDHDSDMAKVLKFVQETVVPAARKAGIYPSMFIKNGGFSDKFNFKLCVPGPEPMQIALNLAAINYDAICCGADGFTEVALRELIPHISSATYHIYNGMPLRPEFRVFYDFDNHQPLYVVNYWDWDYCHEAIERDKTDGAVYAAAYPELKEKYEKLKNVVMGSVAHDMAQVDGQKLKDAIVAFVSQNAASEEDKRAIAERVRNIWSVDVMLCEIPETSYSKASSQLYLIDMAVAEHSAYWDPELAGIATKSPV